MRTVHVAAAFWLADAEDVRAEVTVAGAERGPVLGALAESLSGAVLAVRELCSRDAATLLDPGAEASRDMRLGSWPVGVARWHTSTGRLVYALKSGRLGRGEGARSGRTDEARVTRRSPRPARWRGQGPASRFS